MFVVIKRKYLLTRKYDIKTHKHFVEKKIVRVRVQANFVLLVHYNL